MTEIKEREFKDVKLKHRGCSNEKLKGNRIRMKGRRIARKTDIRHQCWREDYHRGET